MKTFVIGRNTVKVYDSVDEMPIVNFQKYNKYLLIDSGIGSDVDDIDSHVTRIAKFIKAGDNKKALQELQNMRQNLYMVSSEVSPKHLAFAALIHSINGKELTDLSDEGLKEALDKLKRSKRSAVIDFLLQLKKKISGEVETYFPEDFMGAKEKDTYDKLKSRTLLVLQSITEGVDNDAQIEAIDTALISIFPPKSFAGSSSVEVKYMKQFEDACFLISQKTGVDAKQMTVLQFYSVLNNIKKQAEAEAKSLKLNKKK